MRRVIGLLSGAVLALAGAAGPAVAQNLTATDVELVLSRAMFEAAGQGLPATVAVVDRVGNVLGVYATTGASQSVLLSSGRGIPLGNGLEQVPLGPDLAAGLNGSALAAISKAITGAYLSSSGNAFTSRTASQIVQEHFNPGELGQPGGPLFGVQFSQLACSDLIRAGTAVSIGPRRAPLGLAADPGGLPLYKNGVVVGGVGVISDGIYSLDLNIQDFDRNSDELIAFAAQTGYAPAEAIKAYRISLDGRLLRYADVDARHLARNPGAAPVAPVGGAYVTVPGYFVAGAARAGRTFPSQLAGIRPDGGVDYPNVAAFVLDDGSGNNRFAPRDSIAPLPAAGGMTTAEVRRIVTEALSVAYRARAQIRQPFGSHAQVTVSVTDSEGNILAIARTPDGPIFGIDVSLQKARTAAFLSRAAAAAELGAIALPQGVLGGALPVPAISTYVAAMQGLIGGNALANEIAYTARTVGNLARPFFPDGTRNTPQGPFSNPFATWSPFNTGLQLDLVLADIVERLDGSLPPDPAAGCVAGPINVAGTINPPTLPRTALGTGPTRLANGLQIFPGGVPIYRDGVVIGGVGVSGDGIEQDDMVSFLGLHNASVGLGTGLGNAPVAMRANLLRPMNVGLRYVGCPVSPFLNSSEQNVCSGK